MYTFIISLDNSTDVSFASEFNAGITLPRVLCQNEADPACNFTLITMCLLHTQTKSTNVHCLHGD